MPVTVRKARKGWNIVEKTGRVRGHSSSKRNAEISASIRNRAVKAKAKARRRRR